MEKYLALLQGIGLPEKAAKIYLSLLENGVCNISEIQNNTNLHRVEIYRLVPLLIEDGFLIVSLKGKRKLYGPASPIKIEEAYKQMEENNRGVISNLIEQYSQLGKKPTVTYKEGAKGIKGVFNDIIDSQEKGSVFYRITSEEDTEEINKKYLPKNYREKRDKKELERYVIMSSRNAKVKNKRLERELKVIPETIDEFDDNVFMSMYANKIAYINFNTESSIVIENKEIADFQKKLFRLLYKRLDN